MRTKQTLLVEENGVGTLARGTTFATTTPGTAEFGLRTSSGAHGDKFNMLKEQITADLAKEFAGTLHSKLIQQVINEADALAATTPFPALLLPALAEEKVRKASAWVVRQQAIREQTQSWSFALAA